MSHVGRRFDLTLGGEPLRIVVVGQESGLAKGPSAAIFGRKVTMETRYRQTLNGSGLERRYYAQDGYPGRNPHMRGTTTALRLLLGTGLGTDYEGEFVRPIKGQPFHLFDGFALVNRLLCSAGPPGGSQGRPTSIMARNCGIHFAATLSILEPTIVILQGAKVVKWAAGVLAPARLQTEYLYEAIHDGRPRHPSGCPQNQGLYRINARGHVRIVHIENCNVSVLFIFHGHDLIILHSWFWGICFRDVIGIKR